MDPDRPLPTRLLNGRRKIQNTLRNDCGLFYHSRINYIVNNAYDHENKSQKINGIKDKKRGENKERLGDIIESKNPSIYEYDDSRWCLDGGT